MSKKEGITQLLNVLDGDVGVRQSRKPRPKGCGRAHMRVLLLVRATNVVLIPTQSNPVLRVASHTYKRQQQNQLAPVNQSTKLQRADAENSVWVVVLLS